MALYDLQSAQKATGYKNNLRTNSNSKMSNSSAARPQAAFLSMIAAQLAATIANSTTTMEVEEREQQAEHGNDDYCVNIDGEED
jgi:hypothetical protein